MPQIMEGIDWGAVGTWVEAIALVAIFVWDRVDAHSDHKQALEALKLTRDQIKVSQNAERAWLVAEFRPICFNFGGQWHRPVGTGGWVPMDTDEILRGDHHRYLLKFTNMGRTPAQILSFRLEHRAFPTGEKCFCDIDNGDFDQILAAGESNQDTVVNFKQRIDAAGDQSEFVDFYGSVTYRHVFDDEPVKIQIQYRYSVALRSASRIPVAPNHDVQNQ